MRAYSIVTSKDLSRQYLSEGKHLITTIHNPDASIPGSLDRHFSDSRMPIKVGYMNAEVWAPESPGDYRVPSMLEFFLAKTLGDKSDDLAREIRRTGRKLESVAVLDCGAGFLPSFCSANTPGLKRINAFARDDTEAMASLHAYGLNRSFNAVDNSTNIPGGYATSRGNQNAYFFAGNIATRISSRFADLVLAAPLWFPKIDPEDENPYDELMFYASDIGGVFWLAHSSMARRAVKESAKSQGGFVSSVATSDRPFRIVRDELGGPVELTPAKEQQDKPMGWGIIDESFRGPPKWRHYLCVSQVDF